MNTFLNWVSTNRRAIGYTIGGINLWGSLQYLSNGEYGMAVLCVAIGGFIVFDAYRFK